MYRVSIKPGEDENAWQMCKEQGVICIGWPHDDKASQVRRFQDIREGDWVVAHVPESHGGGPGMMCGIGVVTKACYEVRQEDLPSGDMWSGAIRRQCDVDWKNLGKHDLRRQINYWRGTVHQLKPEHVAVVRRVYGLVMD